MYFCSVEEGQDLEVIFRTPDAGTDTMRQNRNLELVCNLTVSIIYYQVHTQVPNIIKSAWR